MRAFGGYFRRHHVALLALFIALGGTSYAAVRLPANSVGSKQLKNGAVTSVKVKDGSLLVEDFRSGQVPAGAQGPAGPQGPVGAAGPAGAAGSDGEQGEPGFDGTALAFATVRVDAPGPGPTFDARYTWGFDSVTSPAPGAYCLTLSDYDSLPSPPIAVADPSGHLGVTSAQVGRGIGVGGGLCPAGSFSLGTFRAVISNGSVIWEPSNIVSFTVVVP